MRQTATIIPCYAADTSGVCAALYELGGMIAVHDASGVNSTYATHDEPRWETQRSMIYVSGLTELDAILGNDEKFIADTVSAANDQHPAFIAVCGSPMPMMIGVDFDAVAMEIEQRSGIRTFPLHTNGMHSYPVGAGEALLAVAQEYVTPAQKRENSVNILGATPLDFGNMQQIQEIRDWLRENGFTVVSCFAMGDDLQRLAKAGEAAVDLVVSQSGLATAQYLDECFGIPYVCGVPFGEAFSQKLAAALHHAAETGENAFPCAMRGENARIAVIGESISAGSIAAALALAGQPARVICPLPHDEKASGSVDSDALAESDIAEALAKCRPETVIADPLYRFVMPDGAQLIGLPHYAFSGRCFETEFPLLTAEKFDAWFHAQHGGRSS